MTSGGNLSIKKTAQPKKPVIILAITKKKQIILSAGNLLTISV